jgi:hypothetical protein
MRDVMGEVHDPYGAVILPATRSNLLRQYRSISPRSAAVRSGVRSGQEAQVGRARQQPRERPSRSGWVILAIFAAVFVGYLLIEIVPLLGPPAGEPVDGIPCWQGSVSYHVHAHLTIVDAGRSVPIPANIGIRRNCFYWLHTHDDSGVIHIEAPHRLRPLLGEFFDIWGQALTPHQVDGVTVAWRRIRAYVDGRLLPGNPRNIPLRAHTTVTIEIGPPYVRPRPYAFGSL